MSLLERPNERMRLVIFVGSRPRSASRNFGSGKTNIMMIIKKKPIKAPITSRVKSRPCA